MDSEHHSLLIKTRALIETTRYEISQLREEIQSAWNTVDRNGFCRAPNHPRPALLVSGEKRAPGSSRAICLLFARP